MGMNSSRIFRLRRSEARVHFTWSDEIGELCLGFVRHESMFWCGFGQIGYAQRVQAGRDG